MALVQWQPRQNRSGTARSAALAPPEGTVEAYAQLDLNVTDFVDPAEILDYWIEWSKDDGATYGHLAGGRFVGGPRETKSGFWSVSVPIPVGCTQIRAGYTVVAGAPIRFGVQGEWR